jgi:hypothetical protein
MLTYSVPQPFLAETKPHHRAVQAAISVIANKKLGLNEEPRGISRAEGGVRVNRVNVKIKRTCVFAEGAGAGPTREEQAVVEAIGKVVALWQQDQTEFLASFDLSGWVMGDPLSDFYNGAL